MGTIQTQPQAPKRAYGAGFPTVSSKPSRDVMRQSPLTGENKEAQFDDYGGILGATIEETLSISSPKNQYSNPLIDPLRSSIKCSETPRIDLSVFMDNVVKCNKCCKVLQTNIDIRQIFYVEQCWHVFCRPCVRQFVKKQFVNNGGQLSCPSKDCRKGLKEWQLKVMFGADQYEKMQEKAIRKMMNIVSCIKCKNQYEFLPGNPRDAPSKSLTGQPLSLEDKQTYSTDRFLCINSSCRTEQCRQCGSSPYHLGYSCEGYKKFLNNKKCRFCEVELKQNNRLYPNGTEIQALKDVCNSQSCIKIANNICLKILQCGHPCCGTRDQLFCIPCLHQNCHNGSNGEILKGQSGEDYCNICFVESLTAAPCVRSQCGHIFHQKCLKKRYQVRWITPRIMFNFCLCPLCKAWIIVDDDSKLFNHVRNNLDLFNKIQKMSLQRLKFQECEKDEKLVNPSSPFFNKPIEYAMAIYAYFQCFKCKNPYFGGRKNCAQAMIEPQNIGDFKPQQLICPNCCEIPIQNCKKHGADFIQFKCKFCCSLAQWFCWGNTHFCDSCHKRQCSGDFVSKYTKDKLPKCQGPGKCPIGGNHQGNGVERSLGCSLCRNYKDNFKTF